MDFDEVMKKIAGKLNDVRDIVLDVADKAGKKAGEVYGDTKIKIKMADIQKDINSLYREVGAAAYTADRGGEEIAPVIAEKCDEIQRLYGEMDELSKELEKAKAERAAEPEAEPVEAEIVADAAPDEAAEEADKTPEE